MKIETLRLIMIPCDSHSQKIIETQNYDNGAEIAKHLKELGDDPALYGWGSWLVLQKSDGVIIGDAGFKGKPNSGHEVEVGYGFLETYWGKGYATEAVEGLVAWAFNEMAVKKVIAETNWDNIGSIRVLEKVGMKKTRDSEDMIYWELTYQKR
ncbi:GNAT family N-acetyltransferase [Planococcus sp. 4-30]|uniref:GNAT family N-acetyltransferase n=1 Tax=Planococcus TaxID=1372 RepID=UPI001CBC3F47|nr:GNAT family N-acetyltransferase [Planococcus sp. 4-30]